MRLICQLRVGVVSVRGGNEGGGVAPDKGEIVRTFKPRCQTFAILFVSGRGTPFPLIVKLTDYPWSVSVSTKDVLEYYDVYLPIIEGT